PSGREVGGEAAKAPPNGGLDLSMVTAVPPSFVMVNVRLAVVPTGIAPKSTVSLENVRCPGVDAAADTSTVRLWPSAVLSVISSVYCATACGSNETSTFTLSPESIVSFTCGAPLTENGALGESNPETVSGPAPSLLKVTV